MIMKICTIWNKFLIKPPGLAKMGKQGKQAWQVSLALLLVLVIHVAVFTACGGSQSIASRKGYVRVYHTNSTSVSGDVLKGQASYYGPGFHGKLTANGEKYDQNALTCAHKSLPFNTVLLVKNVKNGKTVQVRVNDRGPYAKGRILDLSVAAAKKIGMIEQGVATVEARIQ
jgi:rare lipoprotein A